LNCSGMTVSCTGGGDTYGEGLGIFCRRCIGETSNYGFFWCTITRFYWLRQAASQRLQGTSGKWTLRRVASALFTGLHSLAFLPEATFVGRGSAREKHSATMINAIQHKGFSLVASAAVRNVE